MRIEPFTIAIGQAVLDDLNERLGDTRWADAVEGTGWEYGTNRTYLQQLMNYWQHEYDWRAQEAQLNQFAHFKAHVDGIGIHFIHERGKGPNPLPIILTHGWPDSFYRFYKVIPMLTDPAAYGGDPADSFDVIVPSVPGQGFSDRPHTRGMGSAQVAELWAKLMDGLGYKHYAAAGGDIGSEVTLHLAHKAPERLIGIQLSDVSYPMAPPEGATPSADDGRYFHALGEWFANESAYMMEQATKPQTVSYMLNDSPVGLAAWLIEKFYSWGGADTFEQNFTRDELLTNLMMYWATETAGSAARRYFEGMHSGEQLWPAARIEVPVLIANFGDLLPPRSWVELAMNVQRWSDLDGGGHFAALQSPQAFAEEVRAAFRPLRAATT